MRVEGNLGEVVFVNTEEINPHLTAKIVVSYVRHQRLGPINFPI
jgi:hypothetical protein